jgi:PAS domain-containing protein
MPSWFESGKDRKPGQNLVAEILLSTSVVEAIPDAVAAVNQQGLIIQVNSQTESLVRVQSG